MAPCEDPLLNCGVDISSRGCQTGYVTSVHKYVTSLYKCIVNIARCVFENKWEKLQVFLTSLSRLCLISQVQMNNSTEGQIEPKRKI